MNAILLSLWLIASTAESPQRVDHLASGQPCESDAVKLTYLGDYAVNLYGRSERIGQFSITNSGMCDLTFRANESGGLLLIDSHSLRVERIGAGGEWAPWSNILEEVAPSRVRLVVERGEEATFHFDTLGLLEDIDHDDAVPYRVVVKSTRGCWFASEPFFLKRPGS